MGDRYLVRVKRKQMSDAKRYDITHFNGFSLPSFYVRPDGIFGFFCSSALKFEEVLKK